MSKKQQIVSHFVFYPRILYHGRVWIRDTTNNLINGHPTDTQIPLPSIVDYRMPANEMKFKKTHSTFIHQIWTVRMLMHSHICITFDGRSICPRKNVNNAMMIKFAPPAKSVNLSNWNIAAIKKNTICMETVTIALIAKWSSSNTFTAIIFLLYLFCSTTLFHTRCSTSTTTTTATTTEEKQQQQKRADDFFYYFVMVSARSHALNSFFFFNF